MKKYIINLIPFGIAAICLVAFNMIGSEVLSDGTLVEPFYLIPIAWMFFFRGIVGVGIRGIISYKTKLLKKL